MHYTFFQWFIAPEDDTRYAETYVGARNNWKKV
jgi:hypothetical protein